MITSLKGTRLSHILILLPALLVIGCSTKLVVKPTTKSTGAGIIYSLPESNLTFSVTRQITKCEKQGIGHDVQIDTKVEVTNEFKPSSESYVIEYEKLSSGNKTNNLTVELYDDGLLKSVNSVSTDKTAEIISNTASGVASIALKSLTPNKQASDGGYVALCTQQVTAALKNSDALKTDIKKKQDEAKKETALLPACDNEACKKILLAKLETLSNEIGALVEKREEVIKTLVDTESYFIVPEKSNGIQYDTLKLRDSKLEKWFNNLPDEVHIKTSIHYAILTSPVPQYAKDAKDAKDEKWPLVYRQPQKATLLVCKQQCIDETGKPLVTIANRIISKRVFIPQLGQMGYLPLNNKAFQDKTLIATFSRTGALTKLQYIDSAYLAKGASTFKDIASQLENFASKKSELEKSHDEAKQKLQEQNAQNELDDLEHQLSLYKKEKEINDAKDNLSNEYIAIDNETEGLRKEKSLLELQIEVEKLRLQLF